MPALEASVASSQCKPVPNPAPAFSFATALDPIAGGVIGSASLADAVSIPDIETPETASAISVPTLDAPDVITGVTVPALDTPDSLVSITIPALDTPDIFSAVTIPSYEFASLATALTVPTLDTPEVATSVSVPTVETPDLATAVSVPTIDTPDIITATAVPSTAPSFPLTHARILYDNLLFNYSALEVDSGTDAGYAIIPNTYQSWKFTGSGYFTVTLPVAVDMDTVLVGAHNLGDNDVDVRPWYRSTDGGALAAFAPNKTPTNNNAIMFHIDTPVSVKVLELFVSNPSGNAQIGYIMAGIALQMQRPFFGGHTPITDATVTEYYSSRTETVNAIGRIIKNQGQKTSFSWENIDDAWYREYFEPFKRSAEIYPFGIAWNLEQYPDDVGLCDTNQDINAPYSGTRNLRSITFDARGVL